VEGGKIAAFLLGADLLGAECITRHPSENRLISSDLKQRLKQNTLFSRCTPTADLTAIVQESRMLMLLITSLEADIPCGYGGAQGA
jgi:hypothetical protein